MSRRVKRLAAVSAALVLGLGGAAIAGAAGAFRDGDSHLKGPQADRARAAALKITHSGTVNGVERDSEKGATYEVEVRRPDGSTVDVRLDRNFAVVAVDRDSETGDANDR